MRSRQTCRKRAAPRSTSGSRRRIRTRISQFDGLRTYAERTELDIVGGYLDVALSGRRQGRTQLGALMRDARDRALDCVLVWKFDRFARSTNHLLTALEEFDHLGVRFVSVQDQIDTTSPMGEAVYTLIGAMARHSTKLEKSEGSSSSRETL